MFMYTGVLSVYYMHACSDNTGQKRALDPLRLEFQRVESCYVGARY